MAAFILSTGGNDTDNGNNDTDNGGDNTVTGANKITYYSNGGVGSSFYQNVKNGDSATISANSFTRSGYTFTSWNTSANGNGVSYTPGGRIAPANDMGLYAQWRQNDGNTDPNPDPSAETYTVSYSSNGGAGTLAPQTVEKGSAVTVLGAGSISKTGYRFTGWNTSSGGSGASYSPGAAFTPSSNVTLYAQWEQNPTTADDQLSYNFRVKEVVKSFRSITFNTVTASVGKSFAIVEVVIRNNTVDVGFSPIATAIMAFRLVSGDGDEYSFSVTNTTQYSLTYTQLLGMMLGKGGVSATFSLVFEIPDEDSISPTLDWNLSGFTVGLDGRMAL